MTAKDPYEEQARLEVLGDPPIADAFALESLAHAIRDAAQSNDPECLAACDGLRVVRCDDLPAGVDGLRVGSTALIAPRRDRRQYNLAVLHELAHHALETRRIVHAHADVWCLSLALALPLRDVLRLRRLQRLSTADLHTRAEVPLWALRLRLEIAANDSDL